MWINPDIDLPKEGARILIAIGMPNVAAKLEYRTARYEGAGRFAIHNGSYNDSTLFARGWKGGNGNANKVLAWTDVFEYDRSFE